MRINLNWLKWGPRRLGSYLTYVGREDQSPQFPGPPCLAILEPALMVFVEEVHSEPKPA
jgi:hypothetical protein